MVQPIRPSEVQVQKAKGDIPDDVIEAWNRVIARVYDGYARVDDSEILQELTTDMGVSEEEVFSNGWFDILDLYRAAGWDVIRDDSATEFWRAKK